MRKRIKTRSEILNEAARPDGYDIIDRVKDALRAAGLKGVEGQGAGKSNDGFLPPRQYNSRSFGIRDDGATWAVYVTVDGNKCGVRYSQGGGGYGYEPLNPHVLERKIEGALRAVGFKVHSVDCSGYSNAIDYDIHYEVKVDPLA